MWVFTPCDWSVGTKCLPLLAGAAQVLDSGGVQFTTVLQQLVVGAVQAHAGRRTTDDAVRSVMQQSSASWLIRDFSLDEFRQEHQRFLPAKITSLGGDDCRHAFLGDVQLVSAGN